MDLQQEKRYAKLNTDLFYLLDRECKSGDYEFHVSGSTRNVYTVTIYPEKSTIFCTCPDAKSWAQKYDCICKHCLFVLFRVLKVFDCKTQSFFEKLLFTADEIERIHVSFAYLTAHLDDSLINGELSKRYESLKITKEPSAVRFEANDLCGVCFLELTDDSGDTYMVCPQCNKPAHSECIKKWLSSGQELCVYCRQKVWTATKDGYKNLGY